VKGRFAPSPTGPLHFGSLVAAIASWLDARHAGGAWLVRMEDVDETRTVPGAADDILRALEAFGLHWDGVVVRQSQRKALYEEALEQLRSAGLVYRCRCSRKEVADSGLRGIEGAIYPGTCRGLALSPDIVCAERFRVATQAVAIDDRVQGRIEQDVARDVGDFVLKRRDGLHAYQLAVVVDDADQGITDVVRGADLLQSTQRQVLLQRALGYPTPRYLHVQVAADAAGEKLSKQTLASAVDARRAPRLIADALAFLGQPPASSRICTEMLAEAASRWSVERVPRQLSRRVQGV
jgi:glutamyl-Q tRNA(Asp) synthetase